MAEKVRIWNPEGEGWFGTQYEIDGKPIQNVRSVDFRVAVDEVPTFTFETFGMPDIEMLGDVRFKFAPETVEEAAKIICDTFRPGTEWFMSMADSVKTVLDEALPEYGGGFKQTLSEAIVRRMIGCETDVKNPEK
jgi:hypothetical protein